MSKSIIFMDQSAPDGRTIRYNIDAPTSKVADMVDKHLAAGRLVPIPHEDGGDPIFINPERVATISPMKED